jgi:hypothetical protein
MDVERREVVERSSVPEILRQRHEGSAARQSSVTSPTGSAAASRSSLVRLKAVPRGGVVGRWRWSGGAAQ